MGDLLPTGSSVCVAKVCQCVSKPQNMFLVDFRFCFDVENEITHSCPHTKSTPLFVCVFFSIFLLLLVFVRFSIVLFKFDSNLLDSRLHPTVYSSYLLTSAVILSFVTSFDSDVIALRDSRM